MIEKYLEALENVAEYLNGTRNAFTETGTDFTRNACNIAIKRLTKILESIEEGTEPPTREEA